MITTIITTMITIALIATIIVKVKRTLHLDSLVSMAIGFAHSGYDYTYGGPTDEEINESRDYYLKRFGVYDYWLKKHADK